jgi:geranylgeranyl reductase family protein
VIDVDAVIVGGGPAGSTCAHFLRRAGWNVAVLDRQRFPRDKVCAGWLTPEVFSLLELAPGDYRRTGLILQEIRGFHTGVLGRSLVETSYPDVVSYAIRRYEFDHYLLKRAAVEVFENTPVVRLQRDRDRWLINDSFAARVLIGAGGHFCPVARHLQPEERRPPVVVAKEAEVRLCDDDGPVIDTPQLFFCHDLEGYAWCVRKGDHVNIGIGRRLQSEFGRHVDDFARFLEQRRIFPRARSVVWKGHAYLASGSGARPLVADGVMLVGDAAGLAYPESGEGIRPAIASGRLAAETLIAAQGLTRREVLAPYEAAIRQQHPAVHAAGTTGLMYEAKVALGRMLLGSRTFTRHVVMDRWFLRRSGGAMHL